MKVHGMNQNFVVEFRESFLKFHIINEISVCVKQYFVAKFWQKSLSLRSVISLIVLSNNSFFPGMKPLSQHKSGHQV